MDDNRNYQWLWWLKVHLLVVPPLQIWVLPPSWIVLVGVGIVQPLIIVDIVGLFILLEGKIVTSLTIIIIMTPSTKFTR